MTDTICDMSEAMKMTPKFVEDQAKRHRITRTLALSACANGPQSLTRIKQKIRILACEWRETKNPDFIMDYGFARGLKDTLRSLTLAGWVEEITVNRFQLTDQGMGLLRMLQNDDLTEYPPKPDDVLIALLHHLTTTRQCPLFTNDREQIYRCFHRLKTICPNVMKNISFQEENGKPESQELDQALTNIKASGLLREYPDRGQYEVLPELDRAFDLYVYGETLVSNENRILQDAAKELRSECGIEGLCQTCKWFYRGGRCEWRMGRCISGECLKEPVPSDPPSKDAKGYHRYDDGCGKWESRDA